MREPLVTVMMPVYNGMKLIHASIASLCAQTYTNWECVIVDDGSVDGTTEYLDTLNDRRFIVVHFEKNQGRPFARQKALELANGKYLAMLDAEDIYRKNKLEEQVRIMENHPEIILVSSAICSFGIKTELKRRRGTDRVKIIEYSGENAPIHASSMLITERAKKFRYNYNLNFGEDADFLRRYLKGGSYYLDPNILYYYSEFDSVTKQKILSSYKNRMYYTASKGNLYAATQICIKYLTQYFRFKFISTDEALSSRGKQLSNEEEIDFHLECEPFIKNK